MPGWLIKLTRDNEDFKGRSITSKRPKTEQKKWRFSKELSWFTFFKDKGETHRVLDLSYVRLSLTNLSQWGVQRNCWECQKRKKKNKYYQWRYFQRRHYEVYIVSYWLHHIHWHAHNTLGSFKTLTNCVKTAVFFENPHLSILAFFDVPDASFEVFIVSDHVHKLFWEVQNTESPF